MRMWCVMSLPMMAACAPRLEPVGIVAPSAIALVNRRTAWPGKRRKATQSPAIRRVEALGQSACILPFETATMFREGAMNNEQVETSEMPKRTAGAAPEEQLSGVIRYLRQQLGMTQEEL